MAKPSSSMEIISMGFSVSLALSSLIHYVFRPFFLHNCHWLIQRYAEGVVGACGMMSGAWQINP